MKNLLYLKKRIIVVFILGIASGLPLSLTASTLSVYLKEFDISLKSIGIFSMAGFAYSLKFLWSPLVDNVKLPILTKLLGQRRSWMIVTQVLLMCSIAAMGALNPNSQLFYLGLCATLVGFLSATQDIIIDAFRIEILDEKEMGAGVAVAVTGYRVGMIISSTGALYIATFFDWQTTFLCMSLFILPGMLACLMCKEPTKQKEYESFVKWLESSFYKPFEEFTSRNDWGVILLFLVIYKLSDAYLGMMTNPFYMELGFSKLEIANVAKLFGTIMTFVGVFVGGYLVKKIGLIKSLFWGCLFQILSNFVFVYLAWAGHDTRALALTIAIENFVGGIGTVALLTYISNLCNKEFTATQFALLSSFASLARSSLSSSAGFVVVKIGWVNFFVLSATLSMPALIIMKYLFFNKKRKQ